MFSVSSRVDQDNTGTLKRVMGIELIAALCAFGFYSGEMNFYPKN
ncbi:hypothetical protein OAM98_05985 [Schleiferiaceae bacterium]|nr:hypothetical protein [Schleiferiaceae bacterium]